MGSDRIRHLRLRKGRYWYWIPSKTIADLGLSVEALGTDYGAAKSRAIELNNMADEMRRGAKSSEGNGPRPGTVSRLFVEYQASDEFSDLKPRTQSDYKYYLGKIEDNFGTIQVRAISPLVVKTYYKRIRKEKSVTWAYHILATLRTVLSWGVSENWIDKNPALDVKMKTPKKRTVTWTPAQCEAYVAKAEELGWYSIVAMAYVFDSIGQSPVDVRTLLRKSYDGRAIEVTRTKTGVTGAPIVLFPEGKRALDRYLATQPAKLPDAPLFTNDRIGGSWNESTLQKKHRIIRKASGLPDELQLQDFRTTVQTEGGAAGGTVDELRGLARHTTRSAGEHYVMPDGRYVDSVQEKRLAHRNKGREKVETPAQKC